MYKDMKNNSISFDAREDVEAPPRGYNKMTAHVIFEIKIDTGFTCKSRFITDGRNFDIPPSMTYT